MTSTLTLQLFDNLDHLICDHIGSALGVIPGLLGTDGGEGLRASQCHRGHHIWALHLYIEGALQYQRVCRAAISFRGGCSHPPTRCIAWQVGVQHRVTGFESWM